MNDQSAISLDNGIPAPPAGGGLALGAVAVVAAVPAETAAADPSPSADEVVTVFHNGVCVSGRPVTVNLPENLPEQKTAAPPVEMPERFRGPLGEIETGDLHVLHIMRSNSFHAVKVDGVSPAGEVRCIDLADRRRVFTARVNDNLKFSPALLVNVEKDS